MARTSEEKLDYKVVQLLKDKAVIDDARMLGFAIEQFNDVLPACVVRVGGWDPSTVHFAVDPWRYTWALRLLPQPA
jgi:hypothetical protein